MPTRLIKESCRSSKNLNKLSDFEERLFWRLITTADDFGRFMAYPELVRASCFPYKPLSTKSITSALQSMQDNDLIKLYSVDDRHYGYFIKWEAHQGKPRAKTSKYPSPNDAQQNHMLASASICMHPLADVTGHPDTDTDTDTKANTNLNYLSSPKKSVVDEKRPRTLHPYPDDFQPDDRAKAIAAGYGQNVFALKAAFQDHHLAKGTLFKDWQAAFRTWLRNDRKFREVKR